MVEAVPSADQIFVKSRPVVRDLRSLKSDALTRRTSPLVHAKGCLCGKRMGGGAGGGGELDQGAIGSRFTAADFMVSLTYQVFQEEYQGGWLGLNCRAGQNNLHGDGRDAMVSKARVAAMQEKHGSEGLMQSFSTVSDVACIRAATDTGCRVQTRLTIGKLQQACPNRQVTIYVPFPPASKPTLLVGSSHLSR